MSFTSGENQDAGRESIETIVVYRWNSVLHLSVILIGPSSTEEGFLDGSILSNQPNHQRTNKSVHNFDLLNPGAEI